MKRLLTISLTVALVLVMGAMAFAADEGSLNEPLNEDIPVNVTIGPYANVIARKAQYIDRFWSLFGEWDTVDPLMDFGHYSGRAHQGKVADTNAFIVETNTPLSLEFSGTSLTHESYNDSRMLTRYWAWHSVGVGDDWADDIPFLGRFITIPKEIVPQTPIGYFGEQGAAPKYTIPFEMTGLDWFDFVIKGILETAFNVVWPTEDYTENKALSTAVDREGIYAFQVFGFASTDAISSQRAGQYSAEITLTVSLPQ